MRTLVHLSDLHFGRIDPRLLEPLIADVHAIGPDLVVVSGDLTQRAKARQFDEARRILLVPRRVRIGLGHHQRHVGHAG